MWYLGTMLSTDVQRQSAPFWCYRAQNETNWKGQQYKEDVNLTFQEETLMKLTEIFMTQSQSQAHHFHGDSLPGSQKARQGARGWHLSCERGCLPDLSDEWKEGCRPPIPPLPRGQTDSPRMGAQACQTPPFEMRGCENSVQSNGCRCRVKKEQNLDTTDSSTVLFSYFLQSPLANKGVWHAGTPGEGPLGTPGRHGGKGLGIMHRS